MSPVCGVMSEVLCGAPGPLAKGRRRGRRGRHEEGWRRMASRGGGERDKEIGEATDRKKEKEEEEDKVRGSGGHVKRRGSRRKEREGAEEEQT